MKKISKWSLLGYIAGAVFTITSFVQYYVLYRDFDKIIAYPSIGILIMAVAWLYNKTLQQGHTIEAMEEYLVDENDKI